MKVKAKIIYVAGEEETLTILNEYMTVEDRRLILAAYADGATLAHRRAIDLSTIKSLFFIGGIPGSILETKKDSYDLSVILTNGNSCRYHRVDLKSVECSEGWLTFRYGGGDLAAGFPREVVGRYELEKVGPDV